MTRYARLARLLTLTLIVGLLPAMAACSDKGNDGTGNNKPVESSKPANDDAKENTTELWNRKFDPPVTISTAGVDDLTARGNVFKPGETLEDNINIRWMKENMGIEVKFDFVVAKSEDYDTKIRMLLASNAKLPDVFKGPTDALPNLISAGKLMALDEAIDKYAHPEYKKLLEKYDYTLGEVKKDGKLYGLPNFSMGDEGTVMWVRKDWLDQVGLEPPTTLAELENVLKAFTEGDPDNNGQKDTYGLAVPLMEGPWTWMGQTDAIVGALTDQMINTYDIRLFWNKGEDGKLSYGAVHPDAKLYLETMRNWMSKGYMDQEAGIKDPGKASEAAASGKAGVMFGPYWMGDWPLSDVTNLNPDANFEPYPLPAGPNGLFGRAEKPLTSTGYTVFNANFKNMEAWFAYFNKMFAKGLSLPEDPYFDPRFKDGFFEGYDYVLHEGKVIYGNFKEAGVPEDKWPLKDGSGMDIKYIMGHITHGTTGTPFSWDEPIKKFIANPDAEPLTDKERSAKQMHPKQLKAYGVRMDQNIVESPNYFTGPMTETMKSKGELLKKLATESYLKIIYGEQPLEFFDEFVKQWYNNGGQKITDEVNAWYSENN